MVTSSQFRQSLYHSKLDHLQFTKAGSGRTLSSRANKSVVWKFFKPGETKQEMICQLCPNRKIIKIVHGVSSNLMRHLKKLHMSTLVKEKLLHHKMSMLAAKMTETDFSNAQDAEEDKIIQLISEPLIWFNFDVSMPKPNKYSCISVIHGIFFVRLIFVYFNIETVSVCNWSLHQDHNKDCSKVACEEMFSGGRCGEWDDLPDLPRAQSD